ncbi:MAG: hypothetical protein ACUVTW_10100 [Thermogutta sp.]
MKSKCAGSLVVVLFLGLVVFATWSGPAHAWPASESRSSVNSAGASGGFRMPKIPNPLDALANGTRKAAEGIKGLFSGSKEEPKSTGYYNPNQPQSKKPAKQESSFFGIFKKKEPQRVETVRDWMALEPVRP